MNQAAYFSSPRPDLVPIMKTLRPRPDETPGHRRIDLVPDLETTSSRTDTPSRDEVTPPPTSTSLDHLTSSHLVPDDVGRRASDLVPRPPSLGDEDERHAAHATQPPQDPTAVIRFRQTRAHREKRS